MNTDIQKIYSKTGNLFEATLIAAQRVRELSAERKAADEISARESVRLNRAVFSRKNETKTSQALREIEEGIIDKKYLMKIKSRVKKHKLR
jgi:DNA-directed RNA polymerase subunit K/omega